jgi:hypothetical protein
MTIFFRMEAKDAFAVTMIGSLEITRGDSGK